MSAEATTDTRTALERTVVGSFSDMAFMDVIPSFRGEVPVSHLFRISFNGLEIGEIVLSLPKNCRKQIVENVYGENWEGLNATEIDDCLLELLNVIAGNFVQERYGRGTTYDISLPELIFDASMLLNRDMEDYYFDAEGELFKISYRAAI